MAIQSVELSGGETYMTHDPRFDEGNRPKEVPILRTERVKIDGKGFEIPAGAKIETVPVSVAGKENDPVHLQIGPSPGYLFAVFSQNSKYHMASREDWMRVAESAIERWCAQNGKRLEAKRQEPMMPYNVMGEYK